MSQVPTTTTPTPVSMASTTTITAGTPVPTYPSPAHAQWAAGQIQIDPSLQQQQQQQSQQVHASTSATTTPKPQLATTVAAQTPTAQTPITNYYNYQHYPYYQQYMAQAVAQAHSHQAASATPLRTGHTSTPTATATSTPVISSYTPAATGVAAVPGAAANPASLDSSDIATLNDALGSAGVDLRAEEESLQRHESHITHVQSYTASYLQNRPYEDRGKKQPLKPAFDTRALGTTMRSIGSQNKVTKIPEDSVNYVALALRARLQDLITAMIKASQYRKEAQFDRPASFYESPNNGGNAMDVDGVKLESRTPMWSIVVRSDVAKQLSVLERIEREEEMRLRRERKERIEMAATLGAQAAGGGGAMDASLLNNATMLAGNGRAEEELDGQPKKKKKKEGPGVTARNMSEDVRKKMSNAVATQAAGLGKYAWMTAAASAPSPSPKAKASTNANAAASGSAAQSAWARPYVPKKPVQPAPETPPSTKTEGEDPNKIVVTMRDAMFVVEKERGHGGGKGSARGWT